MSRPSEPANTLFIWRSKVAALVSDASFTTGRITCHNLEKENVKTDIQINNKC